MGLGRYEKRRAADANAAVTISFEKVWRTTPSADRPEGARFYSPGQSEAPPWVNKTKKHRSIFPWGEGRGEGSATQGSLGRASRRLSPGRFFELRTADVVWPQAVSGEHPCRKPFLLPQEPKQEVPRANVAMPQVALFFHGVIDDFLGP